MPSSNIISLEIGEGMVKIAEAQAAQDKKRITRLTTIKISSQDPQAIAEEIKKVFQSFNYTPQKIQLNIPRHLVTARFLKIPSVDDKEIGKMISMEFIKHIPYADEDVIYGYRVIEKLEDGYSKVLLVIAQAAMIKGFLDILNRAGIGGAKRFFSKFRGIIFVVYACQGSRRRKCNGGKSGYRAYRYRYNRERQACIYKRNRKQL